MIGKVPTYIHSGGFRGGALGAEAPPFQSPLAFKCTDVAIMLR